MATLSRAERKKLELRQEIIDAAFECFAEHGYHQTSIATIAEKLGIGHGTFYRYFENKRDIIDHVITHVNEQLMTALAADNAPDVPQTLEQYREQTGRIGASLIAVFQGDPRAARLLLLQAPGVDAELTQRVFGFLDMAAAAQSAYLQHGIDAGYLPADLDVEFTARAINGMLLAAVMHGIAANGADTYDRFSAAIRHLMFDGIASSASKP